MNGATIVCESPSMRHRPDIDGLRAVSVIAVVLFHTHAGAPGGYVGVDVFFVISGSLITRLILNDLSMGTFSIADFWERRFRRIMPALSVMIGAVLLAGYCLLLPNQLDELARSSLAQSLLLANVYFWRDTGYFAAPADHKPLLHTWSLAVEEQFYLVFPLFLVILRKLGCSAIKSILAAILTLSFAAAVYGAFRHPAASFFLLPTRAWELLAGSLLVVIPDSFRFRKLFNEAASTVGIAAIAVAVLTFDQRTLFPGFAALLPVGGAAAILFTNSHCLTWVGRLLSVPPLVFVGRISYSLYLWHWPIIVYMKIALGTINRWDLTLAAVTCSLIVAYLSWRYVELPFRRRAPSANRPVLFTCVGALQVLFISISTAYMATGGLPSRHLELQTIVADVEDFPLEYASFIPELENSRIPVIGHKVHDPGRFDFALFGDSHALSLAPLFDSVSKRHGLTGLVIATNGVSPFLLDEYDSSIDVGKRNRLFFEALAKNHIEDVCLVVRWDWQFNKRGMCGAFCSVLMSLEEAGVHRLWLFRQVPCQPLGDAYSQQIIASFRFPTLVSLPRTSVEQYRQQVEIENALFDKRPVLKTLAVELVDTSGKCFDTEGYSRVLESGRALYRDDDHLSRKGAAELLGETVHYVLSRIAKERAVD
jgi:peptidoglycan/LPS O-acetylase OafA/YrhL